MINKFLLKRLQLWLAIFSTLAQTQIQCNITNLRKSRWSTSHDNATFSMIYLWCYIFLFGNALMPISVIIVYCLEYNDNIFYRLNLQIGLFNTRVQIESQLILSTILSDNDSYYYIEKWQICNIYIQPYQL